MEETKSGMGWIGVLFIILVIWAIFGGGFGWNNRQMDCGCTRVSNCEVERREIIDSAETRFLIEQQGAATKAAQQAGFEAVMAQNTRIYEQGLQKDLFDAKMRIQQLEGNAFVKEQTDALAKQYAEYCCNFNRRLDAIECSMLKRPQLYGVAATCSGQVIPSTVAGTMGTLLQ